nr:MAG TPA: hypothetical protein [Caudoviricetes sp.]
MFLYVLKSLRERRIRSDASPFLVPFWLKKWYCKIIAK